jgi:hypothetical protein
MRAFSTVCFLFPFCASVLGLEQPKEVQRVPLEAQLGEELRKLDRDYKDNLEDLLRRATTQDLQDLVADIQTRLAVLGKYRSHGAVRPLRTLKLIATTSSDLEVHLSKRGIELRHFWGNPLSNVTVNGVDWDVTKRRVLGGGLHDVEEPFAVDIDEVVKWEAKGNVQVKRIFRGPGITALQVTRKDKAPTTTFAITVSYRPPLMSGEQQGGTDKGGKEPVK